MSDRRQRRESRGRRSPDDRRSPDYRRHRSPSPRPHSPSGYRPHSPSGYRPHSPGHRYRPASPQYGGPASSAPPQIGTKPPAATAKKPSVARPSKQAKQAGERNTRQRKQAAERQAAERKKRQAKQRQEQQVKEAERKAKQAQQAKQRTEALAQQRREKAESEYLVRINSTFGYKWYNGMDLDRVEPPRPKKRRPRKTYAFDPHFVEEPTDKEQPEPESRWIPEPYYRHPTDEPAPDGHTDVVVVRSSTGFIDWVAEDPIRFAVCIWLGIAVRTGPNEYHLITPLGFPDYAAAVPAPPAYIDPASGIQLTYPIHVITNNPEAAWSVFESPETFAQYVVEGLVQYDPSTGLVAAVDPNVAAENILLVIHEDASLQQHEAPDEYK